MKTFVSTAAVLSVLWSFNHNFALAQPAPAPVLPDPNEAPPPGILPPLLADEPSGVPTTGGGWRWRQCWPFLAGGAKQALLFSGYKSLRSSARSRRTRSHHSIFTTRPAERGHVAGGLECDVTVAAEKN